LTRLALKSTELFPNEELGIKIETAIKFTMKQQRAEMRDLRSGRS
jgi:hypothetical protein